MEAHPSRSVAIFSRQLSIDCQRSRPVMSIMLSRLICLRSLLWENTKCLMYHLRQQATTSRRITTLSGVFSCLGSSSSSAVVSMEITSS
eukprot:9496077-Pyramimonas_sp.AAC.1